MNSPVAQSIQSKRIQLTLVAVLCAEIINKIAPIVTLYIAQARLGVAAFGEAQFAMMSVESLLPLVAFGYGTMAALDIGAAGSDHTAKKQTLSTVMMLRAIHLLVILTMLSVLLTQPQYASHKAVFIASSILLIASCLETDFAHFGTQTVLIRNVFVMIAKVMGVIAVYIGVQGPDDAAVYAAAACAPALILAIFSASFNLRKISWTWPQLAHLKTTFIRAIPYALVLALLTFSERFDALFVEWLFDANATGLYTGQLRLVQSIATAASAIGVVYFAEMVSCNDKESFTSHANLSLWSMLALVAPVAGGIWFVDKEILSLMYNDSFAAHSGVFDFLTLGTLFHTGIQVFGVQVLLIRRQILAFCLTMAASILVGLIVSYALSPRYGIEGVAVGSTVGKLIAAMSYAWLATKYLTKFPWDKILSVLIPTMIMVVVLTFVSTTSLPATIIIGGITYITGFIAFNFATVMNIARKFNKKRVS